MIDSERLNQFVAMWRWLSAHPVNDQKYYLKYVVKAERDWMNECPLSDGEIQTCTGCRALWPGRGGNLCTDNASPLREWQEASIDLPDLRVYFASQVGTLGLQARKKIPYNGDVQAAN